MIKSKALEFIERNANQHLKCDRQMLISRAVCHMMETMDLSLKSAELAVSQALAIYESVTSGAYVDEKQSTPFIVVVYDPKTKCDLFFTVNDLISAARQTALPTPSFTRILATNS